MAAILTWGRLVNQPRTNVNKHHHVKTCMIFVIFRRNIEQDTYLSNLYGRSNVGSYEPVDGVNIQEKTGMKFLPIQTTKLSTHCLGCHQSFGSKSTMQTNAKGSKSRIEVPNTWYI